MTGTSCGHAVNEVCNLTDIPLYPNQNLIVVNDCQPEEIVSMLNIKAYCYLTNLYRYNATIPTVFLVPIISLLPMIALVPVGNSKFHADVV